MMKMIQPSLMSNTGESQHGNLRVITPVLSRTTKVILSFIFLSLFSFCFFFSPSFTKSATAACAWLSSVFKGLDPPGYRDLLLY